ncbi:MAG TPA: nucleoside hydrolase [Streptosporangiaceae bacterium]|jgi:purine nucleosidase
MAVQKIIIDCDPGIDDALALLFAHGHPDLELCGITTVAGNVGLDLTTANALRVREHAGLGEVPVVAGCARPLLRSAIDARDVHGESGLGAVTLPPPSSRAADGHAVDYLASAIGAQPGEITLIAVGPLTNIALAVRYHPEIVTQVRDFVIMGGSAGRGNVTPAAEFNIAADPEAAAVVFEAGWTVTMVGLDVTLQARASSAVRERMRGLGRLADDLLLPSLSGYRGYSEDGPAVHDVCAVAQVAVPGLLTCVPAQVRVETAGQWTTGMTVTDFAAPAADWNAQVAMGIDTGAFWDLVLDTYRRVAAGLPDQEPAPSVGAEP